MIAYCLLILATGAERLAELVVSARNARWSFARGGVEFGRRHFPPMVALHTGLLLACFAEAWFLDRPFLPWLGWPMLALVLASQSLRWWCIAALGPRWNTRVIVIHDLPLVARGPYRWLKHPNYLAVVVEGFALPLVHSAWITALAFTALNAVLLAGYRIPCENSALADVVRGTTVSDAGLIVVGGGPVGLACAIEARLLGMDVLVVEPRSAPIDKACGEGLMPGSLAALHRLGVDPPGRTLAGIAYLDAASRAEHRFKERPGRGVRRTALHSALAARAAELGTHTLHDRVTGVTSASSGTMLTLGRERSTLSAPWVIAADGLHSPLRRLLELGGRPQPESRRRFGVRRHYTVEPWTDLVEVHWSPTAEVYVTPVDDRTIGVAVLGPRPLDQEAIISTVPALAAHLDGAPPASDPRGAGPLLQRSRTRTSGRVLLVGDASGYVDALTGEGMRVGFAQARAAVAAIRSGDSRQYERAWRTSTKDFRTLTTGLVIAARSRLRPRIVPTAAARPALFGAIVERLSQ